MLWRQAAAKAAHVPQFGTGLWSQRNLCLPCVCRVVSPAFGVSKSTFVMPTHFLQRARSTRVVAARRVFAKLSRLSRAVRPGGRQRRGSTRRGAQRARFPLPRHTRPRQAIQMFLWVPVPSMVPCYGGLSELMSSSLSHGQQPTASMILGDPPKIIAVTP